MKHTELATDEKRKAFLLLRDLQVSQDGKLQAVLCMYHTLSLKLMRDPQAPETLCDDLTEHITRTFLPVFPVLLCDLVQFRYVYGSGREDKSFKLHLVLTSTKQDRESDSRSEKLSDSCAKHCEQQKCQTIALLTFVLKNVQDAFNFDSILISKYCIQPPRVHMNCSPSCFSSSFYIQFTEVTLSFNE